LLQRLLHDFVPQHIYGYAFVAKSLQQHVSLRFSAPRYDNYCKIWVKIQKDKSLDKSGISGTFIKTVRDATAKKINRQKSPLAFFIS
jgi:hypothetical protein